jgi:hypothetical protein
VFLAIERLYAEALPQPAFAEKLQQKYRVVIAGPTTVPGNAVRTTHADGLPSDTTVFPPIPVSMRAAPHIVAVHFWVIYSNSHRNIAQHPVTPGSGA